MPAFYDAAYNEDGTLKAFVPNNSHAPEKIKKQVVSDMAEARLSEKTRLFLLLK